jgi:outer membrane receptor protein involved in Fe transport
VSISKGEGSFVELFDIDRVEVAKGPQSTLFGRGALVGALNIIQAKARPGVIDARASVEIGDNDLRRFEGMSNIPIGDAFALRLSAVSRRRDGYVDNALDGDAFQSVDTQAVRASFAWRGANGASVDLIANRIPPLPRGRPADRSRSGPARSDPAPRRSAPSRAAGRNGKRP